MSADEGPGSDRSPRPSPNQGVHLEAQASGEARVHQAGRDQHIHYVDGVRERRRSASGQLVPECPYPGLAAFGPEHAAWFFGRDGLIAELTARLDQRLRTGGIQMVIAPSGAGKSSLLRAGLLPGLDQAALPGSDQWPKVVVTPTADPLEALAANIASLTGTDAAVVAEELTADPFQCLSRLSQSLSGPSDDRDSHQRFVVLVDQFEQLFTLCVDDQKRRTFVDVLTRTAHGRTDRGADEDPVGLVVLGVRADFYAACVEYPPLRAALQDAPLVIGPMSEPELREAILFPARDVGLDFEPGLVEVLLRDLGATAKASADGATSYEAGRLPLLAHALRVSWQQRHGQTMTVAGYRATGGIHSAVATTAERMFTSLAPAARHAARGMFLRLVALGGEGNRIEDTRRRVTRSDLLRVAIDPTTVAAVVDTFTQGRLLTQENDTIEITHEALLWAWPRLRDWLNTDRAGSRVRQELEDTALVWDSNRADTAILFRGSRLDSARTWFATHTAGGLSSVGSAFLTASIRHQRRATGLRRAAVLFLVILAVAASLSAIFAFRQQSAAQAESRIANQQRDLAAFSQITTQAELLRATDPSLAAQLDVAAYRRNPTLGPQTHLIIDANTPLSVPLPSHIGFAGSVAFSPDRHTLANSGSSDDTIRLWNVTDPTHPTPLGQPLIGHTGTIVSVAFSPDGHTLASGSVDNTIRLWNVTDPTHPTPLGQPLIGHTGTIVSVAFSPDGHTLASSSYDNTIRLWNVADPSHPTPLGRPLTGHTVGIFSVAFSPDGHTLAGASTDGTVRLWNVTDPTHPTPLGQPLIGHTDEVVSVAFSPDGHTLASGSADGTVRLWNVADPSHPTPLGRPLTGHTAGVRSVAFSPDGRTLASGSRDDTIRLWNVTDPTQPTALGQPLIGHTADVVSVAFSPDGHTLASSGDKTIRLWDIPLTILVGHTGAVGSVAFSPDGHTLASSGDTIRLWNVTDPTHPTPLNRLTGHTDYVTSVAFSPDGHTLASGSADDTIQLWNVADPTHPTALGQPLTSHTTGVASVAFSPDGHTLASGSGDGTVRLWNVADPAHPTPLSRLTGHTDEVLSVAFSPDGHTLASSSHDNTIRLWNVTDPAHPAPLSRLTGHTDSVASVRFSPDGHTLASGSADGTVRLWNATDPSHPAPLGRPLMGHTADVDSVAFSPDGRTLASGSGDGTVRLWNIVDPAHPAPLGQPLIGHTNTVLSVAFDPHGHTLASSGFDQTIWLWDTNPEQDIRRICTAAARDLTPQQWKTYIPELPYNPPCR